MKWLRCTSLFNKFRQYTNPIENEWHKTHKTTHQPTTEVPARHQLWCSNGAWKIEPKCATNCAFLHQFHVQKSCSMHHSRSCGTPSINFAALLFIGDCYEKHVSHVTKLLKLNIDVQRSRFIQEYPWKGNFPREHPWVWKVLTTAACTFQLPFLTEERMTNSYVIKIHISGRAPLAAPPQNIKQTIT